MLRNIAVLACAIVICTAPARAANHGFYVSVDAGAVDQEVSGRFTAVPLCGILALSGGCSPDQSPDIGWAGFAAVGMKFAGQFRVEGELGYRASTLSSLSDINHLTAMANLLYDIPIGERFVVSLGGGVGADRISWTGYGYLPPAFFTTGSFSGADWHFAAQGLASASFKISESTRLDLKYRYMVPTSVDLPLLNAVGSGGNYEFTADDISTHTVSLGLTFDLD